MSTLLEAWAALSHWVATLPLNSRVKYQFGMGDKLFVLYSMGCETVMEAKNQGTSACRPKTDKTLVNIVWLLVWHLINIKSCRSTHAVAQLIKLHGSLAPNGLTIRKYKRKQGNEIKGFVS